MTEAMLSVDALSGAFRSPNGPVEVLHEVSFELNRGSVTGIVGETGSGKSLTSHLMLQIQPKSFMRTNGTICFEGRDVFTMNDAELRAMRGAQIGIVFQDARAALNPVFSIGTQLADVCRLHRKVSRAEARAIAIDALSRVEIPEPARRARQYPHQFSGGMAQRAMIAMALICEPKLLILDEPTTGLDVTTQAAILDLIRALTKESGLTTCLITHDLGVVAELCEDIVVLHDGRVREVGSCEQIFTNPVDSYTRRLLDASKLVLRDEHSTMAEAKVEISV